jgi:NADPH:quinone reductase-like Zn-dependent oxidoreductase
MKAVVYTRYGGPEVLQIKEVDKPTLDENQVLIKVHASSINAGDYRKMRADPFFVRFMMGGLLRPKDTRLGWDVAGLVEAVGSNVKHLRPGDEVFGGGSGAFAEYVCVSEDKLALKPANVSFEQAAALPVAAVTALQGLRDKANVQPRQEVVIQGASGGVGSFAVQIAKVLGAEVTAVCSTRNRELARSIGADHVIDYTKEDFTKSGKTYDLIFGVNGYHSLSDYRRALSPKGMYLCTGGKTRQLIEAMILAPRMSKIGGQQMRMMDIAKINTQDLAYLGDLLKAGKVRSIIDRSYPLDEIAEAMGYVEKEHAQGKVVITI